MELLDHHQHLRKELGYMISAPGCSKSLVLGQEFGMLALRRVSMFDILKLLRTKEADTGIWLVFDVQSDTAMNGLKDFVGIECSRKLSFWSTGDKEYDR